MRELLDYLFASFKRYRRRRGGVWSYIRTRYGDDATFHWERKYSCHTDVSFVLRREDHTRLKPALRRVKP